MEGNKNSKREHGTGSIKLRKDGRYEARIQEEDINGGKPKSFYGKTEAEAKRKMRAYLKEARSKRSVVLEKSDTLTSDFFDYWLKNIKYPTVKPSSYDRIEQVVEYQLKPTIGNIPAHKLTPEDIRDMLSTLRSKNYSFSTIKKAYINGKACFQWAVDEEKIVKNPFNKVELSTRDEKPISDITYFSEDEALKIRAEALRTYSNHKPVYRMGPLIVLLLNTGLRIGEALALQWDNINFEKNVLIVRGNRKVVKDRSSDSKTTYVNISQKKGKTDKSARTIPLNDAAIEMLKKIREINPDSRDLFVSKNGKHISPRNVDRMFRNILSRCGFNKEDAVGVHSLRHTFATTLFRRKIDIKVISTLLGHSDVGVTYNIYIHVIEELKIEAMERLDNI